MLRIGVADSALKRGIAYGDITHVIATGDYLGPIRDGLIWWIGETTDGDVIEVGAVTTTDNAIIAIHAMTIGWRMP